RVSCTLAAPMFLEAIQLRGPGDRHDPWLLREQRRERDLRRRRVLPLRHLPEQIHQRLVRPARFRSEARHDPAERAERDEPDAESMALVPIFMPNLVAIT